MSRSPTKLSRTNPVFLKLPQIMLDPNSGHHRQRRVYCLSASGNIATPYCTVTITVLLWHALWTDDSPKPLYSPVNYNPRVYVLMQMYHTKATALENLPVGVPPITLLCRTFRVANTNGKKMIVS